VFGQRTYVDGFVNCNDRRP